MDQAAGASSAGPATSGAALATPAVSPAEGPATTAAALATVAQVQALVAELDAHLDSPPLERTPLPLGTIRALRLPLLPPAGASPAYLLLLCDKAFALLDALALAEGSERLQRKRAIEGLKRVEGRVEQWRASLPPPLVLSREPEPPQPPPQQPRAAAQAAAAAGRAQAGGTRVPGSGGSGAVGGRRGEGKAQAKPAEEGFLAQHGPSLGVLVAVLAWAAFYYFNKQ